jgi:uroporphyrinogen III methyltransferase / synthase
MALPGKTILITRAASQSRDLRQGLEALGAQVLECPSIEIVPVTDWTEVDHAIDDRNSYQWIIFTSTNAVEHFMRRAETRGVGPWTIPVAAVGAATARKLQDWKVTASRVPETFRAEGLLEMFPADLQGVRFLFPRAEIARELLPEELRRRGASVDVVTVYRTVKSEGGLAELRDTLTSKPIDAVVFTSPSAVRSVSETLGDEASTLLARIPIAVIGPIAREAVESAGLKAAIQPPQATVPDLIAVLDRYFE